MALARIGLGANLGDAATTIEGAIARLATLGTVVARSSLYASDPWGVVDQPPFVNAAALLETELAPYALLERLQQLERDLGRIPGARWGPRAIDVDILAYGDLRIDEPRLTIPHARLSERGFALVPLAEIDASFATLRDALPQTERDAVRPLARP